MGLLRQNGLGAFRPVLDYGSEVNDPITDLFDRPSIGLIEDREKEEQDDRMNQEGIEHRARVSPPGRPLRVKKFRCRVNGKRKRDLSHGKGRVALPRVRALRSNGSKCGIIHGTAAGGDEGAGNTPPLDSF